MTLVMERFLTDPHQFLGLHEGKLGKKVIRLLRPEAESVFVEVFGKVMPMLKGSEEGLFELEVPSTVTFLDYRVYHISGLFAHDPYVFLPTLGDVDAYLFGKGVHYKLYDVLGAHFCKHQGVVGTKFAVFAPSAKAVCLVGDFNYWDGRVNPMRATGSSGIFELFVPGVKPGEKYKFEIRTVEGQILLKTDPYANSYELRPLTAAVVADVNAYDWKDAEWMEKRGPRGPLNIYEVHLGSWKKDKSGFSSYRKIAHELAKYCAEMGFSHVELLPILEHPLDDSWGYQVTGFFAPTSRYGTVEDFQYFVDYMHQSGIGVILDWVPAHFPTDSFALSSFDGTCLYEHQDERQGFHPHWNTLIFNYGRHEVSNFLIASALFWLEKMHVDGLRVDAVASMLYLDYGREEGQWIPNIYGGRENLEAISFLKHLNSILHERVPGILTFAEESTAFLGVTHPLSEGGLGFDFKWNMGWMHDTLRYFGKDPLFRAYHHQDLTFGLLYAFSEKFLLAFSHDEVVHGKASLLSKMPGDDWQKFASLRLLYSYQICQVGKKLLFMGAELGVWEEWNFREELPWHLLQYERHKQLSKCIQELNHFYHQNQALWELDDGPASFEWVDCSDNKNAVISHLRKGKHQILLCVHHFTPAYFERYFIPLRGSFEIREVMNTDREEYGGSGKVNSKITKVQGRGIEISLSPLSTLIFEIVFS